MAVEASSLHLREGTKPIAESPAPARGAAPNQGIVAEAVCVRAHTAPATRAAGVVGNMVSVARTGRAVHDALSLTLHACSLSVQASHYIRLARFLC